ncbi:hypothetical protein TR51_03815 [Kitasatospora griseola]|uniref:Uncharacterized protein n=1 Tax=Kitasatospora griseola TaxID=2064 RepID=A0A0D0Q6C2_KITGR|nr:DUF664 domain-containing protein [Kitasatospora griseola]KIQ66653.1 hypothetical protein TR51_03815 [Kitasatospora griseola]
MTTTDPGTGLRRHLPDAREVVRWKPDGLPERDLRRSLTPTGTNPIGPVEHSADVELVHLGREFDRHRGEPVAWFRPDLGPAGLEPDTDTDTDHRATVADTCRAAWKHAEELPLDAAPSRYRVPIHLTAGTARHVGRADIVREPIDGTVGHRPGDGRTPATDDTWWYRERAAAAAAEQN